MKTDPDKRFINFPIVMLAETYDDPQKGMKKIIHLAFVEYSKHCRRDYKQALVQAIYVTKRQPDIVLPYDVRQIMYRDDISDFAETAINEHWGHEGTDFVETTLATLDSFEMLQSLNASQCEADFELSESEKGALVDWLALMDSASYFKRRILDYDGVCECAGKSQCANFQHAESFGILVHASIPSTFFFETMSNAKDAEAMRLFRCVCAVRSMVGQKKFTGTTKDMLRARMIGAKTPAVAEAMAEESKPLCQELDELGSRKRFDRILTEGAVRKFYGKFGTGRRVYLSLTAKEPQTLAAMVGKKLNRHASYKALEQKARDKIKGTARGQQEGIDRDSKGGSFNKTLQ